MGSWLSNWEQNDLVSLRCKYPWLRILYVSLVLTTMPASIALAVAAFVVEKFNPAWFLVIVPPMSLAILLLLTVAAAPLRFSAFGAMQPPQMPTEAPLCTLKGTPGCIGRLRCSARMLSWAILPNGIGVAAFPVVSFFIPFDDIERVAGGPFDTVAIHHRSAHVRSPILLPGIAWRSLTQDADVASMLDRRHTFINGLG